KNKTDKEIFYQDFKKFSVNGVNFGVGQINSMNADELNDIKVKINSYMKTALVEQGLDMLFFMLTNIVMESTELLCCGMGAKEQIVDAFDLSQDTENIKLAGVVSRKKQFIPNFVGSLQQ
ncbi:MAG: DHHA2 domain-containing protein, partial [Lachnospiraceae bacterium]